MALISYVAGLLPVYLVFIAVALLTAAWASTVSGFVDGFQARLTNTAKTKDEFGV